MRPWERYWFNLHRHNTRLRKDRQLHHIERALLVWPAHIFARWRNKSTTRSAPKGAFFMGGNRLEDEHTQ